MEFVYNPQVELTSVELSTLDDAIKLFEDITSNAAEEGTPFFSLGEEANAILNSLYDFVNEFVKES